MDDSFTEQTEQNPNNFEKKVTIVNDYSYLNFISGYF